MHRAGSRVQDEDEDVAAVDENDAEDDVVMMWAMAYGYDIL